MYNSLKGFNQPPSVLYNAWQLDYYDHTDNMGFYAGVTYERDWFHWHKAITFDPVQTSSGSVTPRVEIKAKWRHDHYQVIFIDEATWCDQDTRSYTTPYGEAIIHASWP